MTATKKAARVLEPCVCTRAALVRLVRDCIWPVEPNDPLYVPGRYYSNSGNNVNYWMRANRNKREAVEAVFASVGLMADEELIEECLHGEG